MLERFALLGDFTLSVFLVDVPFYIQADFLAYRSFGTFLVRSSQYIKCPLFK